MRDDVVGVALGRVSGAVGEHTRPGGDLGLFLEPSGDLVGLDEVVLIDIEDRLDGEVGVGLAAPLADLLDSDGGAGVRTPADVVLPTDRGVGEVHMENDGAGRWFRGSLRSHLNRRSLVAVALAVVG